VASQISPEYAELATQLRELRPWVKARYPTYEERRDFFQRLVDERLP
jgi:Sirohaem synthase dimerisation region